MCRVAQASPPDSRSREDVMRVDNVHVRVAISVTEESGVLCDLLLATAVPIHLGMMPFDDPADDDLTKRSAVTRCQFPAIESEAASRLKASHQFFLKRETTRGWKLHSRRLTSCRRRLAVHAVISTAMSTYLATVSRL